MSLITNTLFGEEDKVKTAIETLQSFEPQEGYYLAFSGGKDSVTVKALCDLAGVKYDAHYRVTSVDPPELVRFIKEQYPDVKMEVPHYKDGKPITMWNLIPKKMMPPTRIQRYCCLYLKESGGYGRMTLTGVRWAESANRRKTHGLVDVRDVDEEEYPDGFKSNNRGGIVLMSDNGETREYLESCYRMKKTTINPIIDWEDEDVWEFIHKYNVPYCSLYDQGEKRLGCIGCPMSGKKKQLRDFERYPKYKKLYVMAFEKMLKRYDEKNKLRVDFKSGQDVMDWWLEEKSDKNVLEGQISIDEDFMNDVQIDD